MLYLGGDNTGEIAQHYQGKEPFLTLCTLSNCRLLNCRLHHFGKINIFVLIFAEIQSECQTVWISDQAPCLWGLIWIQTVCKGHKRADKSAASMQRVK